MPADVLDDNALIGRDPDRLSIEEQRAVTGRWMAMEIYTPATLPARRIEAIGDSVEDCVKQLRSRGLEPLKFEYSLVKPPY